MAGPDGPAVTELPKRSKAPCAGFRNVWTERLSGSGGYAAPVSGGESAEGGAPASPGWSTPPPGAPTGPPSPPGGSLRRRGLWGVSRKGGAAGGGGGGKR